MVKISEDNKSNDKRMFERDSIKQRGFKRFLRSFMFSVDGLSYAFKNEQSLFIHALGSFFVVVVNILFKVDVTTWLLSILAMGVVLALELVNTAIEAVVDLVTLEIHPLAKIAKDCGSAATFVLTLCAIVMGIAIYVPYIIEMVSR